LLPKLPSSAHIGRPDNYGEQPLTTHNRHWKLNLPGLFHDLIGESQSCYLGLIFMNRIGGFQSSALPTELPGLGMRKRVLNSCARSESSPKRLFRAPGPIIPRTGQVGFIGGEATGPNRFVNSVYVPLVPHPALTA
jgi:hypothetical protein